LSDQPRKETGAKIQTDLASERTQLASERTFLASERTRLAWWRTGLATLAVAIGVGRIVPALADQSTKWPYTVVGLAFALYGVALFAYGTVRANAVESAVRRGEFTPLAGNALTYLTVIGLLLGLATAALIVFS
jgi:putative membrane protein